MRSPLVVMAVAALLAGPVPAQMTMPKTPPGKPDPKLVKSGTYRIDPAHSQVLFTVNHLGFTLYTGMFTNPTGTLVLDTAQPSRSKVEVSFPIAKVRTTVPELDAHLVTADFFDAAKYPTATFVSTRATMTGPTSGTIAGDLTIKGVTRPVLLKARFVGAGTEFFGAKKEAVGFAATTTISRNAFGIGDPAPMVSDKVDLVINAGFEAE